MLEEDTLVSMYSNPLGVGSDDVICGKGNKLPEGVRPKNAENKSSLLKLFEYNFTPKSLMASDTRSLDIPYSKRLSASNLFVISLV